MSGAAPPDTLLPPAAAPAEPAAAAPAPLAPTVAAEPGGETAKDPLTLEFTLPPVDGGRLLRLPALSPLREGRTRVAALHTVWHDDAAGTLAAAGLTLAEQREGWRLERLLPNSAADWPPATPPPVIAAAASLEEIARPIAGPLTPVAAVHGRERLLGLRTTPTPTELTLIEGTARGVSSERPVCRLRLAGSAAAVIPLAREIASELPLAVPRASLAAEAIALAHNLHPPPRRLGAPRVLPGMSVDDALAAVMAHLAEQIFYWSPLAPSGHTPEAVHQMRVAVRRLRSALSVFRAAAHGPSLEQLERQMKDLAGQLGAARDWDVFLAGSGRELHQSFAEDRRVGALLAAARRKRDMCYAALRGTLAAPEFRLLEIELALLPLGRPWRVDADPEAVGLLTAPVEDYAGRMLKQRRRKVLAAGKDLSELSPEDLHETRKRAKRLRYAAEFFAELYPAKAVRRYVRRLEALQEALGAVNDGRVAAQLMGQLGGGAERGFATGLVQGFAAAQTVAARRAACRAWKKFRHAQPFWS